MITFTATILKFEKKGEKTGWTYVVVPAAKAQLLKPGFKKSFRVKGTLDQSVIQQTALIPMGEGDYILPLNAEMRKKIGKRKGEQIVIQLALDDSAYVFSKDMMDCLQEDQEALSNFKQLPGSEQKYFSQWIDSAKTDLTKTQRIVHMLQAMQRGLRYGEMIRQLKKKD